MPKTYIIQQSANICSSNAFGIQGPVNPKPKPETLDPKAETLNPKPKPETLQTLKPKPKPETLQTLKPKP